MNFFLTAPLAWKVPFFICVFGASAIFVFAPREIVGDAPSSITLKQDSGNSQTIVNSPGSRQQIIDNYYEAPKSSDELGTIKTQVGKFIKAAAPIREKLFKDRSDNPWREAKAWESEVANYLESVRPDFAIAFGSTVDRSPLAYSGTSPQQSQRIKELDSKVDFLRQILLK